jgi:hypothetical protein
MCPTVDILDKSSPSRGLCQDAEFDQERRDCDSQYRYRVDGRLARSGMTNSMTRDANASSARMPAADPPFVTLPRRGLAKLARDPLTLKGDGPVVG